MVVTNLTKVNRTGDNSKPPRKPFAIETKQGSVIWYTIYMCTIFFMLAWDISNGEAYLCFILGDQQGYYLFILQYFRRNRTDRCAAAENAFSNRPR